MRFGLQIETYGREEDRRQVRRHVQRLRLSRGRAPPALGALRRHREEAGRPYEEITRTINLWMLLAHDDAERAEKRERFRQAFSVDTPKEAIAGIEAFEAAGAQYAIVKILDTADVDPVRLFGEEVMPTFRDRTA